MFPKIAMNNTGKFIIVWEGGKAEGPIMGISAQMYSPQGKPSGNELEVAYNQADLKWNPVIAMDKQGNFCIAWEDWAFRAKDWNVLVQRLDSGGTDIGPSFVAHAATKDHQTASAIAMADSGPFVVAWFHWNGKNDIYARRFDNKGLQLGKVFRANKSIQGDQSFPVIAMDKKGNFVIAWQGPGENDKNGYVYARRFSRTGKALGAEFPVGARAEGSWGVDIAMNKKGKFVITWVSKLEGTGSDVLEDLKYEIYAQRFSKKGKPQGPPFLVNTNTIGDQSDPAVAMDKKGNFVITWYSANLDGSDAEIFARLFKN